MYACKITAAPGNTSSCQSSFPTEMVASNELSPPMSHEILVSDSGFFLAFLKLGRNAATSPMIFAMILYNGDFKVAQRIIPKRLTARQKMSVFVLPPTPFRKEMTKIAPVTIAPAPNSHRELLAPLAY